MHQENIMYKKLKEEQDRLQKEKDKEMVAEIVRREMMLDQLDAEKAARYREETKAFLLNFKNRANELKLDQDYLDRLLKEEQDRQYAKQKAQWDKDEQARINLLYDVYGDRAKAIEHKKKMREEELRLKLIEKQQVTEDILKHKVQERQDLLNETLVKFFLI